MTRILLTEKDIEFVPFFFEGNQYVKLIDCYWKLTDLLFFYDLNTIKKAKVKTRTLNPEKYIVSFGLYSEYNGDLTLGEWINKNNLKQQFAV